jgi:sigma-E factor negative regulatory protein RseA
MQEIEKNHELVSALADGQLHGEVFASTLEWLGDDEEGQATWHAYHLIGDVLRSSEAIDSRRDAAFVQRLKLGLQQEAVLKPMLDTTKLIAADALFTGPAGQKHIINVAANAATFRWRLVAGLASLALVSVMVWQVSNDWGDQQGAPALAQAPASTAPTQLTQQQVAGGEPQLMLRDPQLDALLAAHRQFGGTSALQMPSGFLRNATYEGAAR